MRNIIRALAFAVSLSVPAAALGGFVQNYSAWKTLPWATKAGYVMGLWDQATGVGDPNDAYFLADREGLLECAKAV